MIEMHLLADNFQLLRLLPPPLILSIQQRLPMHFFRYGLTLSGSALFVMSRWMIGGCCRDACFILRSGFALLAMNLWTIVGCCLDAFDLLAIARSLPTNQQIHVVCVLVSS